MTPTHRVEVAPERLAGWVERFSAGRGEVSWRIAVDEAGTGRAWVGEAADGSWARLEGWGAVTGEWSPDQLAPEASWLAPPGPLLVMLARRGGYAVAVASRSGALAAHKVGTRHVQSRTAAGGWSQQRFARRRANQADALVEAVAGHAVRVLETGEESAGEQVAALVLGGEPQLVDQTLSELPRPVQERLAGLPRRELRDLPDPRRAVLDDAVRRALAVRVEVHNA